MPAVFNSHTRASISTNLAEPCMLRIMHRAKPWTALALAAAPIKVHIPSACHGPHRTRCTHEREGNHSRSINRPPAFGSCWHDATRTYAMRRYSPPHVQTWQAGTLIHVVRVLPVQAREVEQALWKSCHYRPIEEFRARMRHAQQVGWLLWLRGANCFPPSQHMGCCGRKGMLSLLHIFLQPQALAYMALCGQAGH